MKRFAFAIVALLSVTSAHATSLHPCTPRVRALDSILSCRAGDITYSIRIETLMSPAIEMCSGENHYEYHTAQVQAFRQGKVVGTAEIYDSEFKYSLGGPVGNGWFFSPKYRLNLKDCVSPMNQGGMSFGN